MLSLGGVEHLTGGSKAEGRATCAALLALCNREPVELSVDGGSTRHRRRPAAPPVVDGVPERRMRVGCGSATIGMFAAPVARPRRRGGGGRRPHHRRRLRAPGRQGARLGADRHPHQGPPLDPRPLLPRLRAGRRLGRHQRRPTRSRSSRPFEAQARRPPRPDRCSWSRPPARSTPSTCSTTTSCPVRRELPADLAADRRAHRRELRAGALAPCSSWPAPAARCAPASPPTRCG